MNPSFVPQPQADEKKNEEEETDYSKFLPEVKVPELSEYPVNMCVK
jgi:hypothetical protein